MINNLPYSNPRHYWMEKQIHNEFNISEFEKVKKNTNVFKLSHRMKPNKDDKCNKTYYDYIINFQKI